MADFRNGDTLRVEFEGQGMKDSLGRTYLDDYAVPMSRAKTVTVVERRKTRVSDVLTGPELVAWSAPVGSVVKFLPTTYGFWFRGKDEWLNRFGHGLEAPSMDRSFRVEYIPQAES